VTIDIFNTGKIRVQGKASSLKLDMDKFKQDFEENPKSVVERNSSSIKSCSTTYDLLIIDIRNVIKDSLKELGDSCEIVDKPNANIDYRAKITKEDSTITLIQYSTGKLLLQGKTNRLFDNCCSHIEKIATPTGKEVIARFISGDEKSLDYFTARYTPRLLEISEDKLRRELGKAFDYLEAYDRSWFVASECICSIKIPLYEYSPIIMPASKAFEGFARKLLTDIGLFDPGYFERKTGNFGPLSDLANPKRKAICDKDKYAESYLKKLSVALEFNRNFMLHSDDKSVTKVNSQEEGEIKLNGIYRDTKDIFDYFNSVYKLI